MVTEDSSNGVWRGDIEGCSSTFIAFLFHLPFDKRLGGSGNMKVCGFQLNLTKLTLESF